MRDDNNNLLESSAASAQPVLQGRHAAIFWVRVVFSAHLTAAVQSAFVVRSRTILSNRLLEFLIAFPLAFSLFFFPVAMFILVVSLQELTMRTRILALGGALVFSTVQLYTWAPTVS